MYRTHIAAATPSDRHLAEAPDAGVAGRARRPEPREHPRQDREPTGPWVRALINDRTAGDVTPARPHGYRRLRDLRLPDGRTH
jgi:hypothetical protein